MTKPKVFQLDFDELVLWRDGSLAVVSLCMEGRWVRVLEANMGELFFETVTAAELRGLSWASVVAKRSTRRNKGRPTRPSLALAAE